MYTTTRHVLCALLIAASLLVIISCETREDLIVNGMRPVYASTDTWQQIGLEGPRQIQHLGKLALKDGWLFVNERLEGIHIIDNSVPANPKPVGFLRIPGNTDFDFKGDILYADNYADLVVLRFQADFTIEITERIKDLYRLEETEYPANYSGYFECADPSKGVVVNWIEDELINPKCRR